MPRRHRWLVRGLRFGLLTLLAELTGRSLVARLDRALHVMPLAAPATSAYPFLLAAVRTIAALVLAALAWRLLRAHATAAGGERLLRALGGRCAGAPRPRLRLSGRLWLASFAATALWFLVQADAERVSEGRWPLLAPWLHTYALPVFAVLAVAVSVIWSLLHDWVRGVERYALETLARACNALRAGHGERTRRPVPARVLGPRRLAGLAAGSRAPPLPA